MGTDIDGLNLGRDMQDSEPRTRVALSRVGVTGLKRALRLSVRGRSAMFFSEMDLFAHLDAERSGVHMSRFIENIEEVSSAAAAEVAAAPGQRHALPLRSEKLPPRCF